MTMQPTVPWTTRLGTVGESEVRTRLAYFSNPTKYETDLGIDFYCELLENDSPSLPFYVQAKGTEHFDDKWGQSILKSTLVYWLQQPFPVFLLVYDEPRRVCYWMSIERQRYYLIERIFTTDATTIYLTMDRSNVIEQGRDRNQSFIQGIKEDTALVQLFRGQAVFRGDGYVKQVPPPPRTELELGRIKENVRAGLYSLVQYYSATQDLPSAKLLCEFLASFDTDHHLHFEWLGRINAVLGDRPAARANFWKAIEICQHDKKLSKEELQSMLDSITEGLQKLGEEASS
jgi:hypothetical protein